MELQVSRSPICATGLHHLAKHLSATSRRSAGWPMPRDAGTACLQAKLLLELSCDVMIFDVLHNFAISHWPGKYLIT